MRREIATEKSCINDHTLYLARHPKADHAPVVFFLQPRAAPAPCLPAVHPLAIVGINALLPHGRSRLDQVLLRGKEIVICK